MLTDNYLNLHLVRLKAPEQWAKAAEGVYFLFPRGGSGQYVNGSAKQPLATGDVLVLNGGEPKAKVLSGKGSEFAFSGFSLRLDHLFPLFGCAEISLLQSLMDRFKACKFYPASSPLAQECHQLISGVPPQLNLDHRGHLLRLAAAILNEEFKTTQGQRVGFVRAEDHLVQVFERLSADEMLSLSIDDLAQRFGCSRRHLNRLFHQYFGFSVAALRMEMRLLKAVSLLRNCDAKVINVAEQCGFNHLGLFNTCFRRRFGTSPGKWRSIASNAVEQLTRPHLHANAHCPLRTNGLCPFPANSPDTSQPGAKTPDAGARRRNRQAHIPNRTGSDLQVTVVAGLKAAQSLAFQVHAQP